MVKKVLALAGMVFVSLFPATAGAQQADFGALRSSVAACSGVAGPSNGSATCSQWVALAGCIAQQASATGATVSDSGAAQTCGGLAAQAVTALDRAEAICRADATASRRNHDALAALRNELDATSAELATCRQQLATRRTDPVRRTGQSPLRLPSCIAGDYGGHTTLWCETRTGQELTGDDCRSDSIRLQLVRAGCQCPSGALPTEVGHRAVDAQGHRILGYYCSAVFRVGGEELRSEPQASHDPNVAQHLVNIDRTINALTARVTQVEEGLRGVRTEVGEVRQLAEGAVLAVRSLCDVAEGQFPTPQNCSRARLLQGLNLQAPAAAPSAVTVEHGVSVGALVLLRGNGHTSYAGLAGYQVGLPLNRSGSVRLGLGVSAVFGDYGATINRDIFGYAAALDLSFRLTEAFRLGPVVRYVHFLDIGGQDITLPGFGPDRGVSVLGGLFAQLDFGTSGFFGRVELLGGPSQTIERFQNGRGIEAAWSAAFMPTIAIGFRR